ncbi:hypothetical protein NE237_028053 [Protea cynaroides]|uniref:Uncharacterized protein n=1 Tax=Protea cynaroides TaxID=273540 RepID=A0A9Q0GQG2_9MAGN|nr:hypothetical protein NE237_028053 [Protea cynaroides]
MIKIYKERRLRQAEATEEFRPAETTEGMCCNETKVEENMVISPDSITSSPAALFLMDEEVSPTPIWLEDSVFTSHTYWGPTPVHPYKNRKATKASQQHHLYGYHRLDFLHFRFTSLDQPGTPSTSSYATVVLPSTACVVQHLVLASNYPKQGADRKKFGKTRHPIYRGVRKRNLD